MSSVAEENQLPPPSLTSAAEVLLSNTQDETDVYQSNHDNAIEAQQPDQYIDVGDEYMRPSPSSKRRVLQLYDEGGANSEEEEERAKKRARRVID